MKEKINIAELLKDCPIGMELDSTIVDKLYFGEVTENNMIKCYTKQYHELTSTCNSIYFHYDGSYLNHINAKCVIFPKGKTTWEEFKKPFKDGDIVATLKGNQIFIFKENIENVDNSFRGVCYFGINLGNGEMFKEGFWHFTRLATEEEKQKLFKAINDNGYKWNDKTKTLEKLIIPKFKAGDRIKKKGLNNIYAIEIATVGQTIYMFKGGHFQYIEFVDRDYELVSDKFDVATLKPFDKVLVRDNNGQKWTVDMFSFYDKNLIYPFNCIGHYINQCIPYKGNEHLLGTTDDCSNYYKTWE